jgi:hypothetical protein
MTASHMDRICKVGTEDKNLRFFSNRIHFSQDGSSGSRISTELYQILVLYVRNNTLEYEKAVEV